MKKLAVIFDCDGTLVDSEAFHFAAWKDATVRQGGDLSQEEYCDSYVGYGVEANSRRLAEKVGRSCAEQIARDKVAFFHKLQAQGLPPIQATVDFVHLLAREKERLGLKMGVASAVIKEEILTHLRHLGIEKYFDVILSGCDDLADYQDAEGVNKPKPYIYLHAAKILGVKPAECVVIEDSSVGMAAGLSAGCFTIAVPNKYSRSQNFSKAHLRLDSFAGMSVDQFLQMVSTESLRSGAAHR